MAKLVECIPNFSEGRDQSVIQGLKDVATSVPGCTLFDL
ncbi:MAG: glutamate formiminotransferase, partial [Oscillospiraceae bacterium]